MNSMARAGTRAVRTYFTEHAKGFSVEVGVPSFPTVEALRATVGAADQWPLGDAVAYHDWHPDGNGAVKPFMDALATAYGAGTSLEDFERKAQLLNYESHRAIFEGMNAGLWRENSGRMLWMTQPAWPSTMWQILSHDYDTHASFYGVKSASEPVHVQMNLPDHRLMVINNPDRPLRGTVHVELFDLQGRRVGLNDFRVEVAGVATSAPLDAGIGALLREHGLLFVRLELRGEEGAVLSRNAYWPSATPAGQQALHKLPAAQVAVASERVEAAGGEQGMRVTLRNTGTAPLLAAKLTLTDMAGERVLPVYYSDNYVTLMPDETRVITVAHGREGALRLRVRGWNLAEKSIDIH